MSSEIHVSDTPRSAALGSNSADFDPDRALKRCFGSATILQEMVECFLCELDEQCTSMRTALQQGNLADVGKLGHRLKGMAVYLAAERTTSAATRVEQLEMLAESEVDPEEAVAALEQECHVLGAALTAWRSTSASKEDI